MTILVIAEHDNAALKAATLNTVAAARKIGGDVHVLVAGHNAQGVAEAAAKVAGVSKVLLADAPQLAEGLARRGGRGRQEPGVVRGALSPRARQGRQAHRLSLGHHAQAGDARLGSGPGQRSERRVSNTQFRRVG